MGEAFDPFEGFAEVERLVSKVYFRFSHLFMDDDELRDFWWGMAVEEEQHACILMACKVVVESITDEVVDVEVGRGKAEELKGKLGGYLSRGTPSITVGEAFRVALEIEGSEIDAIYSRLVQLGGPKVAKTMENLGVPASVQRQRLKAALRRYSKDSELLARAERL